MHRTFRIAATLAALVLPVLAKAQTTAKTVTFGVSGGLSLPMGTFGDNVEAGYVVAGHVYYKPKTTRTLRFRGDVSFDRWSLQATRANIADASTRSLGFVANAMYDLPSGSASTVKPYLLGGLGFFNASTSVTISGASVTGSSTDVGAQVGGGLTFQLSGFSTFVEAKVVNVFADATTRWIPVTFGVRF